MDYNYIEVEKNKAYKLINNGCLVLVSTTSIDGTKNLAPIAWQTPVDYEPVTKILIVCDKNHKTTANIKETKRFVIIIPHKDQKKLITDCGEVSGKNFNKIEKFQVKYFLSKNYNYIIPEGSIGYIECELIREIEEEGIIIFIGKVEYAAVNSKAYKNRLLCEKEEAKTIHHLGGNVFITPANEIL